ncbi:MAG TPA: aspartate--tRNA(Asn) ligase [Patescibacteria group bacterium]
MTRTFVNELSNHIGQVVTVAGWVENLRLLKRMQFVVVRDFTGSAQAIHEKTANEEIARTIDGLTIESAVIVTGKVTENPQVKLGGLELQIRKIEVANLAEAPLPLGENATQESRLDWRFLDLRSPRNRLIFEIQTAAEHAMREFWMNNRFIEIHSPKLMGAASESGAELFTLDYFDGKAYLAQSPQFYKQMAMAAGFERVFEVGPVFRANPSFTSRHDTEFTSMDVEVSWIESHLDVMRWEENWLQYVLQCIQTQFSARIRDEFGVEIVVPTTPFPRVTMKRAYEIIESSGHTIDRGAKGDLDPEGERRLSQRVQDELGHEFVFVTDYPISVRPFYHMRHADNPTLTKSFDLLWKGLEVTTGAQREHRYYVLMEQVKEKGLNPEPIRSYLDCFRYGCPPHGGYGFGLTRMLMVMLGLKNVREVTYLYRGPNRLSP